MEEFVRKVIEFFKGRKPAYAPVRAQQFLDHSIWLTHKLIPCKLSQNSYHFHPLS